jgi:RNA polymerase sigma-70 factor, ECF subfamily
VRERADLVAFARASLPEVHRYVSRLTGGDRARTEDLTQEAFLKLAGALASGELQHVSIGWLIVTARYAFLHSLRRDRRDDRLLGRLDAAPDVATDDVVVDALDLRAAMGALTDTQRAVLVFRYFDDLPVAEVARLLDRSMEATESLLVRARARLRVLVTEA